MALWKPGTRHTSWASNTNAATVAFAIVFVTYCTWSIFGPAPPGLTTLLGVAGGAWFGAIQEDKRRKEQDVAKTASRAEDTADRAESKADQAGVDAGRTEGKVDRLTAVAEKQHPGSTDNVANKPGEET